MIPFSSIWYDFADTIVIPTPVLSPPLFSLEALQTPGYFDEPAPHWSPFDESGQYHDEWAQPHVQLYSYQGKQYTLEQLTSMGVQVEPWTRKALDASLGVLMLLVFAFAIVKACERRDDEGVADV